jgi:peptidoglycan-associated lipoprotein
LLDNADGSTGRVVYSGPGGTTELRQAREAVALNGPATPVLLSAEQLQRDAGAAMAAQPLQPRVFVLYFDAGTSQMNAASRALLPDILSEVKRRPAPDLSIVGHTDTVGAADRNVQLALRRAEQVAQLLREANALAQQVEVTSHGESNLLVATPDETAEALNRRVEVTVR